MFKFWQIFVWSVDQEIMMIFISWLVCLLLAYLWWVLALMPHLFDYKCYSWNELSALSFWPPIWLLCFLNWNSWGDALTKYIIFFQSATQSHIIYTLHCFCDTAGKLNYLIPNCLSFSFVSCLHCQTGFLLLHLICNFLKVDMFGSFEFRSHL